MASASDTERAGVPDLRALGRLAALELSEDEQARFGPQCEAILRHASALAEIDTSDVEPLLSPRELDPASSLRKLREDVPREATLSQQLAERVRGSAPRLASEPIEARGGFEIPW